MCFGAGAETRRCFRKRTAWLTGTLFRPFAGGVGRHHLDQDLHSVLTWLILALSAREYRARHRLVALSAFVQLLQNPSNNRQARSFFELARINRFQVSSGDFASYQPFQLSID